MAKRKKAKTKSRRRSRVGALSLTANSPLVKFGSIAVGYLASDTLNEKVAEATGYKVDSKIIAGAQVALGLLLLMGKGKKSTLKTAAGGILTGAGLKAGLKSFGVINGFTNVPVISGYNVPTALPASVNGFQNVPVVSGLTVPRPMHQQVMGAVGADSGYTDR